MEERVRATDGQAASEYVALLALVAVVLTLAAGLTAGGIGARVLAGLQRGLCAVAGQACPAPTRIESDLDPCPLERSTRAEELSGTIGVVRLGSSGTLGATRTSDGRVAVTLADGSTAGGQLGAGVRLRIGRRSLGGHVDGGATLNWTSGRVWHLPSLAAAQAFIARYGGKATIGGRLLDQVRSRCSLLCDAIGWRPHPRLPQPDETYEQRGASAALTATLGEGPATATARAQLAGVLGMRRARDGSRTWYVQLNAEIAAELGGALAGASLLGHGQQLVSWSVDARGRPTRLAIQDIGQVGAGAQLHGAWDDARGRLGARSALMVEHDATLDLRDPANRAAAGGVLTALLHPSSGALAAIPAQLLARRIAQHAVLDRRVYALRDTSTGVGAGIGLEVGLGADFDRTTQDVRLLSAETRLPGLPFLPRDDCRPA
jgi:hypothetical protein